MASATSDPVRRRTLNSPTATTNQTLPSPRGKRPSDNDGRPDTMDRTSFGETILRGYANHIDPLETNGETRPLHEYQKAPQITADLIPDTSPIDVKTSGKRAVAATSLAPLRVPQPYYRTHRKSAHSIEIPQQTIMKALASRSMGTGPLTAPLSNALNNMKSNVVDSSKDQPGTSPSLTTTLAGLHNVNISPGLSSTATMLMKSPCFFHQRLEGVVDMQRMLEDVADEDYTHSRLIQTATTVRETARHLQRRPIKQAVRTVMIVTKARDNNLVHLTRELAEWLLSTPRYGSALGVKVYVDAKLRHSKRFGAASLIRQEPKFESMLRYWTPDLCWSSPEIFDLVLTLGGDGTVLFTSWLFQRVVPPILSFSMGSLGFLTNFAFTSYKDHLNTIMGDTGMRLNLRMRFTCTVWRSEETTTSEAGAAVEGEQFEVLNELVIDRGPSPYVSNLELWENDHLLTIIQADGCIFSTPTGSTAYSLSAGGALVSPEIPAVLLTPICPHTLSFRPMLLSDTVALRICVPSKSRASVYCSFDGKGRIELKRGDYVTLEASQYPFPTVMTSPNEWLESVQRKLQWNTREVVQQGWEEGQDGGEDQTWDIDTETAAYGSEGLDSGLGGSVDGEGGGGSANGTGKEGTQSPMRKGMSLLNM